MPRLASFVIGAISASLILSCGGPSSSSSAPAALAPSPKSAAASAASTTTSPTMAKHTPESTGLGRIEFPITTGSEECAKQFREGMLALHSFAYDRAHASFESALVADASCAMAAWGDAMAHVHPIWRERDAAKGRAALAR